MLELILASFVGAIVILGAVTSYNVISDQYQQNKQVNDIRNFAVPTMRFLAREIRMAGYKHVDEDIESDFGRIDNPIVITDAENACCDSIQIVYDRELPSRQVERYRKTYYTMKETDPFVRFRLFVDIERWQSGNWQPSQEGQVVSDYLEDFQVEGSQLNSQGFPTLLDVNIVFKSKNKIKETQDFEKSDYAAGNNNFELSDRIKREEFEMSLYLRYLVDYSF